MSASDADCAEALLGVGVDGSGPVRECIPNHGEVDGPGFPGFHISPGRAVTGEKSISPILNPSKGSDLATELVACGRLGQCVAMEEYRCVQRFFIADRREMLFELDLVPTLVRGSRDAHVSRGVEFERRPQVAFAREGKPCAL